MKKIPIIVFCSFLLLIVACDKPNDAPQPNPVPIKTDTLSAGWSQLKISNGLLSDIYFQDAMVGYTGGKSLYKTNDGGATWIKVPDTLNVVNLFVTPDGALHAIKNSGVLYKKFTNWAQNGVTTIISQNGRGDDLYFINNNNGFLTTENGFFKTTDGGNKWDPVTNASGLQLQNYSAPCFIDTATGWIFAGNKIFRSNGTITSWSACNMPLNPVGAISSMYVVSANMIYAATFQGSILKSTDAGKNFQEVAKLATKSPGYADIHFLDNLNGYASQGKRIYQTKDGGHTLTTVVELKETEISELHFTDPNHGWACTADGRVLKYER